MAAKRSRKVPKKIVAGATAVKIKPRNPFVQAVVQRKGGAHRKTEQALRKQHKDRLVHALRKLDVKSDD